MTAPDFCTCQTPSPAPARGLTLVELLVTVSLLAVLLSLAAPSMSNALRAWQRDVATRAFVAHLQLARSAAITSSRRVVICASADGLACAGTSDWMQGWMVFVDENADLVPDTGRPVLAVQQALTGLRRMEAANGVAWFFFLPPGLMPARQTTVTIEPEGGTSVDLSQVTISSSGRVKTARVPRT